MDTEHDEDLGEVRYEYEHDVERARNNRTKILHSHKGRLEFFTPGAERAPIDYKGEQPEPAPLDFDKLCTRHRKDLLGFAVKLVRSKDIAQDLVQDTYLRALSFWSLFTFQGPGDVSRAARAWLYRILMNIFVNDYRRGAYQRQRRAHRYHDVVAATYGNLENDPRTWIEFGVGDEVASALGDLCPEHREILERAMQGQSYKDMARELDIPIGTVMSRLHRARQQVRPVLASYAADTYGLDDELATG